MKKLLLAVALFAVTVPAMAVTPVKLSLWDGIAVPSDRTVHGLELGIGGNNAETKGIQFDLIWAKSQTMVGWQGGWIISQAGDFTGLQTSLLNMVDDGAGVEFGFVNYTGSFTGIQFAAVNWVDSVKGVQLGFANYAENMTGLQLGFVNYARTIGQGVQLGFLNIAENGFLPIMVFVNGRF
ncbi:hypothetical protein AAIR98_001067 [Elusimicrobium simillimum]|uniref:LA_2272 family surface repeat-containing protein n=1 Tax=Elusimicrobium simillimum TaxID=3143438 RepID=UPI003C6EB458